MDTHPVAKLSYARRCATVAVAAVAAAGLLTMAGSAGAQPQPTVSQVQAKLKKLTDKENWLIQRYDQAKQNLVSARQRLSMVNTEVSKDAAAAKAPEAKAAVKKAAPAKAEAKPAAKKAETKAPAKKAAKKA